MFEIDALADSILFDPEQAVFARSGKQKADKLSYPDLFSIEREKDRYRAWINRTFVPLLISDRFVFEGVPELPCASARHFTISRSQDPEQSDRFWIEDCSENGTYLNGTRIHGRVFLEPDTWIFAAGALFVWRDGLLLAPALIAQNHPDLRAPRLKRKAEAENEIRLFEAMTPPSVQEISIEAPAADESRNLPASSSPAGMMVISSMASVISGFLLHPQDLSGVLSSFMGASISAAAFMGWYGWQGHKQKKRHLQSAAATMESYLRYLEEQAKELDAMRLEQTRIFLDEQNRVEQLSQTIHGALAQSKWKMPAGIEYERCIDLKLPKLGWQFDNDRARRALDRLNEMELSTPRWMFLQPETVLDGSFLEEKQIADLFLLWCWMVYRPGRRFVWIGFEESDSASVSCWKEPIFPWMESEERAHPAMTLDGSRLCFSELAKFLQVASAHPEIEWTICTRKRLPPESERIKAAWIDCSQSRQANQERASKQTPTRQIPLVLQIDQAERKRCERQSRLIPCSRQSLPVIRPACLDHPIRRQSSCDLKVELAHGVYWDLVVEGPHALIAGMTGSGKSEGLCAVLFQLAWQNAPDQLQMILIDFKGGSFGAPLLDLPHTAGYMTNLQAAGVKRMEQALEKELARRQEAISRYLADHPDAEPSLEGCPDLKLSHVLICVDEFGQLKSRHPEFMKSLQETARIGRSLGIHLILSTQKPAGLVDEQIWANSKSRLCFSVLDPADSREVLGHEEAAQMKEPGQFILQVQPDTEKRGRAFYLKAPADGRSMIETRTPGGSWMPVARQSMQDYMRSKLLEKNESRRWILHPDPAAKADEIDAILIDEIDHLETLSTACSSMAFAGSKAALKQALSVLIATETRPVYSMLDVPGITQHIAIGSLFDPALVSMDAMVIVDESAAGQMTLLEQMLANPQITLVLALETVPFALDGLLSRLDTRIFLDLDSRDARSLFFSGKNPALQAMPAAAAWISGQEKRVVIGQKKAPARQEDPFAPRLIDCRLQVHAAEIEPDDGPLFLGMDAGAGKPVFFQQETLTLVWSTPAGKEIARSLFERLRLQDPLLIESEMIRLCPLEGKPDPEVRDLLKDAMTQGLLVYAHQGLQDFSFDLNIRLPYELKGNACLVRDGEVLDLQCAKVIP